MNIAQNGTSPSFWSLWNFLGVATYLTIVTLVVAHVFSGLAVEVYTVTRSKAILEKGPKLTGSQRSGTYSMYHRFRVFLGSKTRKTLPGADE